MLFRYFLDLFLNVCFEFFIIFIHIPRCSGDVSECSMFRILSTFFEGGLLLKLSQNTHLLLFNILYSLSTKMHY